MKSLGLASLALCASLGLAQPVLALPALALPPAAQTGHAHHAGAHHATSFQSERLHVMVEGLEGGPDLVLIPGLSSSPRVWQDLTDRLKDRYRIHRIHVNGFGGAPAGANAQTGDQPQAFLVPVAEEISRYIAEAGLKSPAVIGHSLGGTLAMTLSSRHPDSVSKVMVVDMLPFIGAMFGPAGTTADSIKPTALTMWQTQSSIPREQYDTFATASINGMIKTEALRQPALDDMKASDQKTSAAAYYDLLVTDLRPDLPRITAPLSVLYVAFEYPGMTPETTDGIYRASYQSRPNTVLKRIDNSAHFIMYDQPEIFAAEVDAFLSAK